MPSFGLAPFVAYPPEDLERCMKQQLTSDATNLLRACAELCSGSRGTPGAMPLLGRVSSVGSLLAPMSSQVAFATRRGWPNKPRS